ncbi:ABC transporter permease [Desertifilum sp. FACHB-1129]|uniref:Cell division protein FtsX n=1 Tax=Desertifilum tharense IPPAS B-1220 TaxID=1781255 RepID=A0A1E5QPL5_9CYAN|nr:MULTISPECIES: ABC transporter permease [Desertifilum]MDA0209807.1 ABC transporter permease [Cyanobacteria bacterium FC1]MBD2310702.1 ABC transporter permease [Desertifilum sp. FACHB-1129]MBD2320739.1 ABC transporter permease [Desertifilum sp. FACHB-866]MBD2330867.1 ABC transporter permease [Desertifilum sp. FACHB-868]OEJ76588.1 cell division protein [Desertifilum tharense IPPAS B-1220]
MKLNVWQAVTRMGYVWREMVLGLRRGGWMNWAAVSTVTVLLFLFGTSLQVSWQLENLLNQFGSQLEVSAYLEPGIESQSLVNTVTQLPGAIAVRAIPKQEAWETLMQEMGLADIAGVAQLLNGNPLVDELRVKSQNAQEVPMLVQQLKQLPGVEEVLYGDEALKQLAQLHQGINTVSGAIAIALTLSAIAVITTTIRLIVLSRRTEIEIMQLVGATKGWIALPFLLQGICFGVVGGAIAWGLISLLQRFFSQLLADQLDFVQFLTTTPNPHLLLLPIILMGFGSCVGLLGSWFAVRRIITQ